MSIASLKKIALTYPAILLWVALVAITRPNNYEDSYEYVHTIMDHEAGRPASHFLVAGHTLWRPIGEIVHRAIGPLLALFVGNSSFAQISASLILVVFVLTIAGIFYLYKLLRLFPISESSVQFAAILYVISQCVLNFSQTATSYQAGLSVLIIGLYYAARIDAKSELANRILAAALLAIAPLLWLPYVLALPAAVFARPLLYGLRRDHVVNSLKLGTLCGVMAALLLLPVVWHLHLFSWDAFSKWAFRAAGAAPSAGPIRTLFGLPKTLFYLGNDGLYVKRFLYHDPLNPVSISTLTSLGLWKLVLFYLFLIVSIWYVWRRRPVRRFLIFLAAGFIPVLILSFLWDGAALERHMPLFPFLFILLSLGFDSGPRYVKLFFGIVLIVTFAVNVNALWSTTIDNREKAIDAQIEEIWPRLNDSSIVSVLSIQDDLFNFQGVHPFDTFNQSSRLQLFPIVAIGDDTARFWKNRFENAALFTWHRGGDVWVSRTLLCNSPAESVYWIENYQKGLSWKDICHFFQRLDYSDSTRSFMLLKRNSIMSFRAD